MQDDDALAMAIAQVRMLLGETIKDIAAASQDESQTGKSAALFFPRGVGRISIKVSLEPAPRVELDVASEGELTKPKPGHDSAPPPRMAHPILVQNMDPPVKLAIHKSDGTYGHDISVPGAMTIPEWFDSDPH